MTSNTAAGPHGGAGREVLLLDEEFVSTIYLAPALRGAGDRPAHRTPRPVPAGAPAEKSSCWTRSSSRPSISRTRSARRATSRRSSPRGTRRGARGPALALPPPLG